MKNNILASHGVAFFCCKKIFNDGCIKILTSNFDVAKSILNSGMQTDWQAALSRSCCYYFNRVDWLALYPPETILMLHDNYQLKDGLAFALKTFQGIEQWEFVVDHHTLLSMSSLFRKEDFFKQVCFYLKDQYADDLLSHRGKKIKLISIEQSIATQRYYIDDDPNGQNNYLTRREVEAIHWCAAGKSAAESSLIMNITERTVKAHLENAKRKLGCYKQAVITRAAMNLGLAET